MDRLKRILSNFPTYVLTVLKNTPLWVYPLLITLFLFFPTKEIPITSDGWAYMSQGLNIALGRGFTDVDGSVLTYRAPVFPLWLALFFKLFGPSLPSAFVASRVFYVAGTLLIYFLAARLYDRWVGLFASLLVLTSYSLSEWSALVHLDYMLPAMVLLYLLALLWAFEKQKYWQFALVGFLIGITYLLKEVALLFVPLPFLLWLGIREFRTKRIIFGIMLLWLTFCITVVPWWIYVQQVTQESAVLGQGAGPGVLNVLVETTRTDGISWLIGAFTNYYSNTLARNFGLGLLFMSGWFIGLAFALYGKQTEQILLAIAICFLPIIIFQGLEGWRPHQSIIFFLLSYIVIVGVTKRCTGIAQRQFKLKTNSLTSVQLLLFVILLFGQVITEHKSVNISSWYNPQLAIGSTLINSKDDWFDYANRYNSMVFFRKKWVDIQISGWGEIKPVAEWVSENIQPGTAILSSFSYRTALYFSLDGQFPIYKFPVLISTNSYETGTSVECDTCQSSSQDRKVLYLWMDPLGGFLLNKTPALAALTEEELLSALEKHQIHYIIVSHRLGFQSLYLDHSPYFAQVAQFDDGAIKLFKVENISPISFDMQISDNVIELLSDLPIRAPEVYQSLEVNYFRDILGLSQEDVQNIKNANYYSIIETNKDITPNDYVNIVKGKPHGLEQGVMAQLAKISRNPDNPWPYVTLGALYLVQDNVDEAVLAYQQAVSLNPNETQFWLYLARAYLAQVAKGQDQDAAFSLALEAYRQALGLDPTNAKVQQAVLETYLETNDDQLKALLDQSLVTSRMAITDDPTNLNRYFELAQIYQRLGQRDEALALYRQAVEQNPDEPQAHYFLGRAYQTQGRDGKALEQYDRALELKPDWPLVYRVQHALQLRRGDTESAANVYQNAATQNPAAAWPHLELGQFYLQQAQSN